ncbi:UNVERIFIED_CONTAM: Telomere repeat-binding factor 4 [Sesamum calycinum]|uniref:MYB transcription factor n=1 Tax=Sesamum calycinum TaxID=2727403 RepID=A0AAW2SZM6_9LAMI
MGNQKLKWTTEEEAALMAGVAKHGPGKWKNILVDSEFAHKLASRSNVDLKVLHFRRTSFVCFAFFLLACVGVEVVLTKWRNMGANYEQGSGDNAMTPKGKATAASAVRPRTQTSSSAFVSKDSVNEKLSQGPQTAKCVPKYNAMILEALSSIKDRNGSDFWCNHAKKYEVQQSFRRLLSSKLRRLVLQGTLEKVQKRYKIRLAATGTKTPTQKTKGVNSTPLQKSRLTISAETVEDAAKTAADKIAEAENKSFVAAEAVKESERVSRMAEDADALLMHLKEVLEQCSGVTVVVAD